MIMAKKQSGPKDFVDYFFQKEGDTFISQLLKLRDDFSGKCVQSLSDVSSKSRKDYDDFTSRLLNPDKIAPNMFRVENFDFDKALTSIFENLNLNVTDTLEMISKYYGFIANLQTHWKGLELDPSTVIDTSVQLMATLESMVYPLFLKLTNYIGILAQNPKNASASETPEMMIGHLHKLSEALTMEIATIGASGVVSLGQCPTSSRQSIQEDSVKLGSQGRNAKNCITWALKAVAPALQYYYLTTKSLDPIPSTTTAFGGCPCANKPKPDISSSKTQTTSEEDANNDMKNRPPPPPPLPPEPKPKPQKSTQDVQSQAKDDRFVTTATINIQVEEESVDNNVSNVTKVETKKDDEDDDETGSESSQKSISEKSESVQSMASVQSRQQVKPAQPVPTNDEQHVMHPLTDDTENFQMETRENGEQQENDFVSYFFKKNGIKYVAILAQTRKKYEQRCKSLLALATPDDKNNAKSFIAAVHDARKMSPVTGEVEIGDFNFPDTIASTLQDFDISIEDKLSLLGKYQDYIRGMIRHWRYRIENNKALTPDTVVDVGVQIMATTMALTYPIFIRIGEFLRKLSRSPDSAKRSPTELATLLHTLVEANGLQIAAIGTSCLSVISSMPNIKSEALDENRVAVEAQMVLAKNSIAWAMKAISPLLLLFYIKVNMSVQETPEMRGPRPKPKPVSNDKPEDAIVIPIIPTARGDDQSMDEIQQEIAATPNTPYQNALHDNYALKYYQKPAEPQNFVYYFYAKEGQELSALLTDMRTKYENYVHSAMDNIKQPVKDKVSEFVTKYHDARKPTVPSDDMGVSDINFRDDISKIFSGLDMKLRDNLATLTRYFEFTKNMESHWNYRIKKNMELDQDAVLEVSIEMMGTTVALTYPIFIKIAEYIVDIMKTNKVTTGQLSPNSLVERFKKFSFLLTTEMAAIGMSCTTLMAQIPKATRESVSTRTIRLANETKIADGAISWAMKAVFPIMMIYFLQYESA